MKVYGLIRYGNRYFYSMGNQAVYVVQVKPFPAAWKKTPSTAWKRTRSHVLNFQTLGIRLLELDPLAEFDRSETEVFRLVPSTGKFEFEPQWDDSIPFTVWAENINWREIVSALMSEIDPKVIEKLRQFSHCHLNLLEALHDWSRFSDLLESNAALAVSLAGRIRVRAREGEKRSPLDYGKLVERSEREIATALGFGDSEEVVNILRKLLPDACKPSELKSLSALLRNHRVRRILLDSEIISYPALLFLHNQYMVPHLTGKFITEISKLFPAQIDILTCPWGPMLRGGSGTDHFTRIYEWALDIVHFYPHVVIESLQELTERHFSIAVKGFCQAAGCL